MRFVGSNPVRAIVAISAAALLGLALMLDSLHRSSATYDEVAYLRIAADWWRTGDQTAITRMGSPLLFWKIQQAPVLWFLDRSGRGSWIDDPIGHQSELLPLVRAASLWIWLGAFCLTVAWSRRLHGWPAAVFSAWLFALSPNLRAHGALVTMEMPVTASLALVTFLFWKYLSNRQPIWLIASALAAGLAFSCKFTTALFVPIMAVIWWLDERGRIKPKPTSAAGRVIAGMALYVLIMLLSNCVYTGFATLPLSKQTGDHPWISNRLHGPPADAVGWLIERRYPSEWVGFMTQLGHQSRGGPSYLFGERSQTGWRIYYLVALAVKVPLGIGFLFLLRILLRKKVIAHGSTWILPTIIVLFIAASSLGSTRNYGVRYLLPLAPLAIVWLSGLATAGRAGVVLLLIGVLGQGVATASIHPYELSYFNILAGGPEGGKRILSDSNLDWGQGLRALADLQRRRPEFEDLTLFYFGDTDPSHYGVKGRCYVIDAHRSPIDMPKSLNVNTRYVAVSRSLQYGPWGPEGYFRVFDTIEPIAVLPDGTIAIYPCVD